jgi:hypothetical protein
MSYRIGENLMVQHKCGALFMILWKTDDTPEFHRVERFGGRYVNVEPAVKCHHCEEELHPFKSKDWAEA